MGTPGIAHRFMCSRAVATLSLLSLFCLGCGNPFTQFYTGSTITEMQRSGWKVVSPTKAPEVMQVSSSQFDPTIRQYVEDGWLDMGYASWNGTNTGTVEEAKEQAKKVGAEVVLWSSDYKGTSTASIPITTPTASTSYVGGTAYGTAGSASYSGTVTTYGSQTTMMSVPRNHYLVWSAFLCKNLRMPAFGIIWKRMTPDDQKRAGTVNGLTVDLVIKKTPAASSGILPDDVLVRMGDYPIHDGESYNAATKALKGQMVEVEWIRDGKTMMRKVRLVGDDDSILQPYRRRASTETPL